MEQPYRPPTAVPPSEEEPIFARRKRMVAVVRWLGSVAVIVGVALIVFLRRDGIFFELDRDSFPAGYPEFMRKLVIEFPDYPIGAGVILALAGLVAGLSGRVMQGLVLAFLAVGVIGGWAGVLFGVLQHVIRSIAT